MRYLVQYLAIILAVFFATFIQMAEAEARCGQSICIKNDSRQITSKRWDWKVFIDPDSRKVNSVKCVEYTLHSSFPDPVRLVCDRGDRNKPFSLSSNGWGTFVIQVRVLFRNGKVRELEHELQF